MILIQIKLVKNLRVYVNSWKLRKFKSQSRIINS